LIIHSREISPRCFRCGFHMESILLLFQDCPISKDVCVVRLHTKQQGHEDVDEPPDYYSSWSSYSVEGVMLAWTLWHARNLHLFISGTNANCKFYLENCIRYLKQVSGSNTWTINGLASQPRGVNVATTSWILRENQHRCDALLYRLWLRSCYSRLWGTSPAECSQTSSSSVVYSV
jgi:hypothetical protein